MIVFGIKTNFLHSVSIIINVKKSQFDKNCNIFEIFRIFLSYIFDNIIKIWDRAHHLIHILSPHHHEDNSDDSPVVLFSSIVVSLSVLTELSGQ